MYQKNLSEIYSKFLSHCAFCFRKIQLYRNLVLQCSSEMVSLLDFYRLGLKYLFISVLKIVRVQPSHWDYNPKNVSSATMKHLNDNFWVEKIIIKLLNLLAKGFFEKAESFYKINFFCKICQCFKFIGDIFQKIRPSVVSFTK